MQKYKVAEPYRAFIYFPYLQKFDSNMKDMLSIFSLEELDFSEVSEYIAKVLDQINLPDFVIRFDNWLKIQKNSSLDRYKNYFKDSNEWRVSIRDNNKYIVELTEIICKTTIENIKNSIFYLIEDHNLLINEFGCPPSLLNGKISLIGGDRHNNGQQPVMLTLDDFRIVYKPRPSGTEYILNEICNMIGMSQICPKTIVKQNHLWQEFVENRPLDDINSASRVFNKYGSILAVSDLLNINDCHFENFIVDRDLVWMIDSETSFQYFFDDDYEFERSVYQTGLLQSSEIIDNGMGHTSAITAIGNSFQSYCYPYAINDGTENIKVSYERGYKKLTKNFPYYNQSPIYARYHIKDVIDGYSNTFKKLKSKKDEIIELLYKSDDLTPRYLIRTTAYYLLVINKIINPLTSNHLNENLYKIIDKYLRYPGAHPRFEQLIPYEKSCLENYDVPFFYSKVDSRSLFDGNDVEYKNFFPISPIEQLIQYFNRDNKYLLKQHELIRRSMRFVYKTN